MTHEEVMRMDVRDYLPLAREMNRIELRQDWDEVIRMVNRNRDAKDARKET